MKKKRGLFRKLRAAKKRLFGVIADQGPLRLEDILGMGGFDIPFVESENAPRYVHLVPRREGTTFVCDDSDPRFPALYWAIIRKDTEYLSQLLTGHL